MAAGLLLLWLALATVLSNNLGSPDRLFNDYADRADYFLRGSWLPMHALPYRDVESEYPQIPTFLFGLLYLPFLHLPNPNALFFYYSILFSFLMILLYLGLAALLDHMLPAGRKNLVLLLLLPAPLYFSYNRFDVLPSLTTLLALLMVKDSRWEIAGVLLGIGTLTKWYPGLLVLPVSMYMVSRNVPAKRIMFFLASFTVACIAILAPTYLTGGLTAVLSPYVRLGGRGVDLPALPFLLEPLTRFVFARPTDPASLAIFIALQFSVLPIVVFARPRTFERLLGWCLLALAVFTLSSTLYSPQWLLWLFPLMILLARNSMDLAVLILYGTLTYLEYPVLHVGYGSNPVFMTLLGWMNVVMLLWIIARAAKRLIPSRQVAADAGGAMPA